jgi:hypothetical protein
MRPIPVVTAICVGALAFVSNASTARADYRPPEAGYDYGEIANPRELAMGGAVRATGWSTSSLLFNPANMVLQRVYHAELLGTIEPAFGRLDYGAGVVDSITNRIAGGFYVLNSQLGTGSDPYQRQRVDTRVSVAYPASDKIAIGLTAKWLQITQNGDGPFGPSPVSMSSGNSKIDIYTADAGITFTPSENIRLALVAYNPFALGTALAPMMFGAGFGFTQGALAVEADGVLCDQTTWGSWKMRAQVGAEYFFGDAVPVRLGYTYDDGSQRHSISGGAGYVSKNFAIDGGVRVEVASPSNSWAHGVTASLSLRLFLESYFNNETAPQN